MPSPPNWSRIANSASFRSLMAEKTRFLVPVTLFFLAFYFALPLMTSYSTALNRPALGSITWAWVFAFAQFIMTWSLCALYTKRAERFDAQVVEVIREAGE